VKVQWQPTFALMLNPTASRPSKTIQDPQTRVVRRQAPRYWYVSVRLRRIVDKAATSIGPAVSFSSLPCPRHRAKLALSKLNDKCGLFTQHARQEGNEPTNLCLTVRDLPNWISSPISAEN
jgi:hypothetical protein